MRKRRHIARATQGGAAAFMLMRRREIVGLVMAAGATLMIFINALFLQHGPHPAPIFATQLVKQMQPVPAPVPAAKPASDNAQHQQLIADIQRELFRHGFYDGATDGVWGARTDAALRDFLQAAGLQMNVEPSNALLRAIGTSSIRAPDAHAPPKEAAREDPIAQLLAPSKRVLAIQRALADFGYGQIKPTGLYDPHTHAAIERFQRERRLPVNGDISDELVRELAAVTGRPLE